MKKKQKNVVEGAALFSLAITAGIATAQYRANIPMKSGKFDLVSGQKNQNDAGELKEPAQENGGRDKAAKGLTPGQSIAKNPYIVSKADQSSQAYMKVNIPLFTEGAVAGKDTITLQNVSKNWVLLSDSKSDTTHTLIYGYKMKLAGDNSSKPEAERAKTDSLFTAFKITDEAVTSTYVGSLDVYGMLTQSEKGDIKSAFQDAEFNSDLSEDVFMISYDLNGGTLEGQKYLYTKDDYGYTPPTPTKDKYTFTGWSPAKIAEGSNSDIVFSAGWKANTLGNIKYNLNGGTLSGQKTSYTVEDYGYIPPEPTREGYIFGGWTPIYLPESSKGDITFTAKWGDASISSSVNATGGTNLNVDFRLAHRTNSKTFTSERNNGHYEAGCFNEYDTYHDTSSTVKYDGYTGNQFNNTQINVSGSSKMTKENGQITIETKDLQIKSFEPTEYLKTKGTNIKQSLINREVVIPLFIYDDDTFVGCSQYNYESRFGTIESNYLFMLLLIS